MLRRLVVSVLVIAAAVGLGRSLLASGAAIGEGAASLTTVQVVEFYHPGLDHYFMTADPIEIEAIDAGILDGWARTGYEFLAYSTASVGAGLSPVCRFYGLPAAGLDSHFYSGSPAECAAVLGEFPSSWVLESSDVFQVQMPDASAGTCADGTEPVYRLWNNRTDSNHRYTTDPNVRMEMIASGYISEGYGPNGVAFCAPTSPSASISVMELAPDTFDFSAIATPSSGAQIVAYAWDFGDGGSATRATASHQFTMSGAYPVVLTVTDSKNVATNAVKTVTATKTDFDARKSAPGVVRWFDFDTAAQLGTVDRPGNFGILSGTSAAPVLDSIVKASGTGSLRMDVPSQSGPNAGGTWYANFSPDLLTQFGENSEFFIQWRQRFNQAFIDTFFQQSGGTPAAIKQAIITTGDQPGKVYNSCEATEVVVTTYAQHRFPTAYNSCAGSGSTTHAPYSGFYEPIGSGDFLLENTVPSPGCTYSQARAAPPTATPPGCFSWVANEWMTFQVGITLGPRDNTTNDFSNSRFRLWAAREGQPSQLLIDWQPGVKGYFPLAAGPAAQNQQFGKIWLLPYMTSKDPTQVHPLAQTWYDELIVSRQRIPDPGTATTAATPTSSGSTGTQTTLSALPANTAADLGGYQCSDAQGEWAGMCRYVTDFSGMVYDQKRQQMVVFGGGHASTNYDAINTFPSSSLRWLEEYAPTPATAMTVANYDYTRGAWLSGSDGGPYPRAAARHTVDLMDVVGDELILLGVVEGSAKGTASGDTTDKLFRTSARIAHYNFASKAWSFSNVPGINDWSASAYDPVSGKIIILGSYTLSVYDPAARTLTTAVNLTGFAGLAHIAHEDGSGFSQNPLRYNNNLVYFPPNQKMYYFERFSGGVYEVNLNRGNFSGSTITLLNTTGTAPPNTEIGYGYDSVNGIIGGGPVNNVFYAFDPATKAWTAQKIQGGAPGSVAFHALDYDPINNVFIFITDKASGRRTWAYRYK